jgi:hypothetical protein
MILFPFDQLPATLKAIASFSLLGPDRYDDKNVTGGRRRAGDAGSLRRCIRVLPFFKQQACQSSGRLDLEWYLSGRREMKVE